MIQRHQVRTRKEAPLIHGPRCGGRRATTRVIATMMLVLFTSAARLQAAPLIEITVEVFSKVRALAQQARESHLTSPSDAAAAFNDLFEAEFGDVMPKEAVILLTDGIGVLLHTPLSSLRDTVEYALLKEDPLPEMPFRALVVVSIHPRQLLTPNVTQVVLYRGTEKIAPVESDFGPKAYSTRAGAKTSVGAGTLSFPFSAFAPGAEMKLVLVTNAKPIEWRWSADARSALK
jgi:hypothetical protein